MDVVAGLSWVVAGAAIALATLTLVVFRRPVLALHLLLDLLLAAGLLRLSVDASWSAIAVTALIVVIRRVVTRGLLTGGARTVPLLRRS